MTTHLSPHFSANEFACHCGCGAGNVDQALLSLLETIRNYAGDKPVTINSGRRCHTHNTRVGGAKNSQHVLGRAADITIRGLSVRQVSDLVDSLHRRGIVHVGGIGRYKSFTHVDVRKGPVARWLGKN